MTGPDVVVTWLQNEYGKLGRAAESVAHALIDEQLARKVIYIERPLESPRGPSIDRGVHRGLSVYQPLGTDLPATVIARAIVDAEGLVDPVMLNFGVDAVNWWFQHGFGPFSSSSVLVVYDVLDAWPGAPPEMAKRLRRLRQLLINSSDAVAGLSEGAIVDVPGATYVGHGCDAVWTRPGVDAFAEPADLARVGRPRALYYGALKTRIDARAVDELASSGVEVVLVGFSPNPRLTALIEAHPHIHFLGQKTPDQSPAYLLHCDVALVPHTDEPFTASMEPHKIYNYACAGLRTVALNCVVPPSLDDTVTLTRTPSEFVAAVHTALAAGRLPTDRVAAARSLTWGSVARHLLEVAGAAIPPGTPAAPAPAGAVARAVPVG